VLQLAERGEHWQGGGLGCCFEWASIGTPSHFVLGFEVLHEGREALRIADEPSAPALARATNPMTIDQCLAGDWPGLRRSLATRRHDSSLQLQTKALGHWDEVVGEHIEPRYCSIGASRFPPKLVETGTMALAEMASRAA